MIQCFVFSIFMLTKADSKSSFIIVSILLSQVSRFSAPNGSVLIPAS